METPNQVDEPTIVVGSVVTLKEYEAFRASVRSLLSGVALCQWQDNLGRPHDDLILVESLRVVQS
ncbi:MAG: hypothetical protein BGO89_13660 [Candidatus Kapaibacterium thiocyanatum]|uniref:Uncharacterized protein n=1 Tax=Candidatus Kapaibacterium thiocyanatum TaxID=1895771 RepID=A0A1M3KVI2_9BACT|nr:MAG: hypothetical protein BGO89_13660 ['Candidatus Kapabacteria' thiocyanatum]